MVNESHMFILLICLYLYSCSFSSHALAATTGPEHMSNVNMEETLVSRPNVSLIQQVMAESLFLLKKILAYKVLLIVISIAMIYTLYEDDNSSLQHESSKTHRKGTLRKSPPNPRQKKHLTGPFESLDLSERRYQPDSQKEVEYRQNQMIRSKDSETQHQQRSSDASKGETPKRHQPDVEREGPQTQQNQMVQTKDSETQHQQKLLNVSKEEGPKKPCLSQKKLIPQDLERERDKKREKSDNERLNIGTELSLTQYIQEGQQLGNGWIWTDRGSNPFWVYHPDLQQGTEGESRLISHVIPLRNSFIPHPCHDALWINPKFYTESDVAVLATTSKYAYIQSKKLSYMGEKDPNSYMFHPAYKTCVLEMSLRVKLIETGPIQMEYFDSVITKFEGLYALLFDKAREEGYVSYTPSKEVFLFYMLGWGMTVNNFLNKFFEKRQWILEDLQNSKDTLKGELEQAMKEWISTPNYDFIPQIQEVDSNSYEKFLKRMQSLKIPFYNCPKISQLLVSSIDVPLKLFLFWDIFDALKMEILGWDLSEYDKKYFFNGILCICDLISSTAKVYSNQNRKYLEELYFELSNLIQKDFFRNGQLYNPSQTGENRRDAFNSYMLDIRRQVQTFLKDKVFNEPLVAIRV